jgi:hypothetical protein
MNLGKRLVPISFMMMAAIAPIGAAVAQEASPVASPVAVGSVSGLTLIGEQDLSNLTMVDGTLVGGLSGIDFDPATGGYTIISDDRSDNNPARFYSANLTIGAEGFEAIEITGATTFLQADGQPYPNADAGGNVPDPESIRYDAQTGGYWWTSEGNRSLDIQPSVNLADANGQTVASYPLPETFDVHSDEELGSRNNLVLEGLTLSADGQSLYLAMEGPLYQDGGEPTPDAGSVTRIIHMDREGNVLGEFAYEIDPLPATPEGDFGTNGVTEILAIDDTHFLIIERGGIAGLGTDFKNYIRVYMISTDGATDVSGIDALAGAEYTPVTKTLVVNFEDLGLPYVDNVEGMTWGPTLADGSASVIFVSDNNFTETQKTQFFVFAVQP